MNCFRVVVVQTKTTWLTPAYLKNLNAFCNNSTRLKTVHATG